ncbi:unnamed protein product [Pleuronectes platessa]|uniref:Uncharacterized protein n=1 Tax=Pleuronectes platessa TaxID=8262 RepID=A0A9N7Y9P6_PLEPL|nr:unnamed protein product [Pleuronectes platessa]
MTEDEEGEEEEAEKSESLGASDDLFTSRDCMRGMNVALCTGQTVGSNKERARRPRLRAYRCLELRRLPPASTGSKQLLSERDRPPRRDWEGANGQKTRKSLFHSVHLQSEGN